MASVRWREDRACWVACYALPNGIRKQVSTGLTSKEDRGVALQVALQLEEAGKMATRGTLTRQRVLSLLDEIAGAAGMPSLVQPITTKAFIDRWTRTRLRNWSQATAKRYDDYTKQFLSALGDKADKPISFLDVIDLAKWRDDRLMHGVSPSTVNGQIKFLRPIFKEALAQGALMENPFENLTLAQKSNKTVRKEPFTREHFERLLRAWPGEWRVLFLIAFYTGQRDRDCRSLDWSLVDWPQRIIRVQRMKTRDELAVPMHPRLFRHLRWWHYNKGQPQKGRIMPQMWEMNQTGAAGFQQVFRMRILPRIGIVQPYDDGPGRTPSRYSFHSFRHALATALNEVGASEVDRMAIVGHSDRHVSRGYTHAQIEHLRSVLSRV